jgi:hypothetical protein
MRSQATKLPRSTLFLSATLLCVSLLASSACKQKAPKANHGGAAQAPDANTDPAQTASVFDEPDEFAAPDPHPVVGLDWDLPEGWEPINEMKASRLATWRVDGDNEGIFAFAFYMGESAKTGSPVQSNAIRWGLQVRNFDGSKSEPSFVVKEQGGLTLTSIRLDGDQVVGMLQNELELGDTGGSLIGVVIEGGPVGTVYFRLSGPTPRVDALLPAFNRMLDSVRIIEGFEKP